METKVCTSDLANNEETITLSPRAYEEAMRLIEGKILDGLALVKVFNRNDLIEWHFDDESIVEMEVLRDFNDNMNPVAVIVTEWIDEPCFDNFYTIISRHRFELIS